MNDDRRFLEPKAPVGASRLAGGYSNVVVRKGDTVRREPVEAAFAVHRLLDVLESEGYPHSPRFLGIDNEGREVLSYVPGVVGHYPLDDRFTSLLALRSATRMLRSFHDVSLPLLDEDLTWPNPADPSKPAEVICHHDFAPYNLVFRHGEPVAMIDFDRVGPGLRMRDIAYLAYRFGPLSAPDRRQSDGWSTAIDPLSRLEVIIHEYGSSFDWQDLVPQLERWLEGAVRHIESRIADGDPSYAVHRSENHVAMYRCDLEFLSEVEGKIIERIHQAAENGGEFSAS